MVLIAAMVAVAAFTLAQGADVPHRMTSHEFGRLRTLDDQPKTVWTRSSDDLPGFTGNGPVTVADTYGDMWLLAYPSGIGRAFLAVNQFDGSSRWDHPVVAGLGGCAFDGRGKTGCAIKLGSAPDGFYPVDSGSGELGPMQPLQDTGSVIGVGRDFIRVNQVGYRVSATSPDGATKWSRTFADSATPSYLAGPDLIDVSLADASHVLLDPATGEPRLTCSSCTVTAYPTGLVVARRDDDTIDFYRIDRHGRLVLKPTHVARSMQVSRGPAALPVLGGIGSATVGETHGRFEVRDPAKADALWQVNSDELSKAAPMACGTLVAFGRKDLTREVMRLDASGTTVGRLPAPDLQHPDTSLAELKCIGSFGDTLVAANDNQLTAFDAKAGKIRWALPINGTATNVNGYIVLRQGSSLSLLG